MGYRKLVKELVPVFTGFKPALDAYRISSGGKQAIGQTFDPVVEMTLIKAGEMFAEAIPGVIIQLMAIARTPELNDVATAAWISLCISALSTGFTSATISYDWDTDPENRQLIPDFYGYVPTNANQRSIVFTTMTLYTSGMLLIRCMTIVILATLGIAWVFAYIGVDILIYFTVKLVRRDFWYWMPVGGKLEIISSLLARFLVKVITDFTALVQFRHPNEVGGFYWSFSFVLTMGSLPVAVILKERQEKGSDSSVVLAKWVTNVVVPLTAILFVIFFTNIDRKYLGTFFSTQRGKDLAKARFRSTEDDATKADAIFNNSRHYWVSIEDEVRTWVEASWSKWEEEKPKWLDENLRSKIPVGYIPTSMGRTSESLRRASVKEKLAQGVLLSESRVFPMVKND